MSSWSWSFTAKMWKTPRAILLEFMWVSYAKIQNKLFPREDLWWGSSHREHIIGCSRHRSSCLFIHERNWTVEDSLTNQQWRQKKLSQVVWSDDWGGFQQWNLMLPLCRRYLLWSLEISAILPPGCASTSCSFRLAISSKRLQHRAESSCSRPNFTVALISGAWLRLGSGLFTAGWLKMTTTATFTWPRGRSCLAAFHLLVLIHFKYLFLIKEFQLWVSLPPCQEHNMNAFLHLLHDLPQGKSNLRSAFLSTFAHTQHLLLEKSADL